MPRRYSYPENLLSALHLNEETQRMISYDALTDDQRKGLEYALSALSEREQIVLQHHFCEGIGYKAIGLHYNLSESRTRNIIRDALRWLHKSCMAVLHRRRLRSTNRVFAAAAPDGGANLS